MSNTGQQMRFTDQDLSLIRNTFKDNEPLLKLLRKVFLPEIDPNAPIGQMIDLWMTVDVETVDPERAVVNLKARNSLITHIEQQLMQLKILAEKTEQTPEELLTGLRKDSSK